MLNLPVNYPRRRATRTERLGGCLGCKGSVRGLDRGKSDGVHIRVLIVKIPGYYSSGICLYILEF